MRICFIANLSSIHVRRIISYYVREKDDILVLSSAPYILDIPGVQIRHLVAKNGHSSKVSTHNGKGKIGYIALLKSFIPISLKIFVKNMTHNLCLLHRRTFCKKEIERFDPEVIYCFRSFPEGILASYCHVRPSLLRTAGSDISQLPKYPIYRQIIRKTLQTADVVVTESLWERNLLRNLCGAGVKPEVSIIGVDTTLFQPPLSRDNLRGKYGLPREAFVVISNRHLDGCYNGWMIVKTIQSVIEQCPDLVLLYLNPLTLDRRTRIKADAIASSFPRIKFLDGPLPHSAIPEILGCGDIYISFSSFDGIPNSLLEAMACGLVPIVGDLPQLHEWIEQGITGYFVPQQDMKSLGSVIHDLYENRQALTDMSARCVSKIREHGTFEVCSERTRMLLQQLVHISHDKN
jgi:glycosyltransferase involved in cell wall biosynthesis